MLLFCMQTFKRQLLAIMSATWFADFILFISVFIKHTPEQLKMDCSVYKYLFILYSTFVKCRNGSDQKLIGLFGFDCYKL